MRFVTIRDMRMNAASVLRKLPREGEVVLTHHGHPIAIVTSADESNLEDTLRSLRQIRALQAVDRMQRSTAKRDAARLSRRRIAAEVAAVRRDRKQ